MSSRCGRTHLEDCVPLTWDRNGRAGPPNSPPGQPGVGRHDTSGTGWPPAHRVAPGSHPHHFGPDIAAQIRLIDGNRSLGHRATSWEAHVGLDASSRRQRAGAAGLAVPYKIPNIRGLPRVHAPLGHVEAPPTYHRALHHAPEGHPPMRSHGGCLHPGPRANSPSGSPSQGHSNSSDAPIGSQLPCLGADPGRRRAGDCRPSCSESLKLNTAQSDYTAPSLMLVTRSSPVSDTTRPRHARRRPHRSTLRESALYPQPSRRELDPKRNRPPWSGRSKARPQLG